VAPGLALAVKLYGLAVQATGNHDVPALAQRTGGEGAMPGALLGNSGRKDRMDLQWRVLIQRRRFPQHIVGISTGLGQLQVGRAKLISACRQRDQQHQHRDKLQRAVHHLAGASTFSPSRTTS
jgi:hypothetical protein